MSNSKASRFFRRRRKRRDQLKIQGGDEVGEENGRSTNYFDCEDYTEYPRPHRGLNDPIQMRDQYQKMTSSEVNPMTGQVYGMNPIGAIHMTPMGPFGMNSMCPIGMNPMGINQMKSLQNPINPMEMRSQDNQFQLNSSPLALLNNGIGGANIFTMMMMKQFNQQQQHMMMMSMAMNPMLGGNMGINGMNIMGGFNPYAGMLNPAMMQQQQQWLKSQNQTQPIQLSPLNSVQKEKDSTSEGEIRDSDESESDSDSSSGRDKKRMELIGIESSSLSTHPPVSPSAMAVNPKKQRTEVVYDTMDLEFRNPNAEGEIEIEMQDPITPELKQTNSPVGDENVSTFNETPEMDEYTKKLKDYRARVVVKKKNHIWSEIAKAEGIEETAQQFDVVSMVDTFSILRGPESYVVGAKRKRKLPEEGSSNTNPTNATGNEDDYESDSSISSGGLSDSANEDLKIRYATRKSTTISNSKTGNNKNSKSVGEAVAVGFGSHNMDIQTCAEVKPKKKSAGRVILEEKMANMLDYKVAFYVANKLKEHKKHLFSSAMKLLGREILLKLFFKTLKIERLGGMMIKNKSRRRTPGGVFLYLVRNDARLSKEIVDEIFKSERDNRKIEKRKANQINKIKWWGKIASKVEKKLGSKNIEEEDKSNVVPKIDEVEVDSDIEAEEVENSYDLPVSTLKVPPSETMTENLSETAAVLETLPPPPPPPPREQNIFYGDIPADDYLDLGFDPEEF